MDAFPSSYTQSRSSPSPARAAVAAAAAAILEGSSSLPHLLAFGSPVVQDSSSPFVTSKVLGDTKLAVEAQAKGKESKPTMEAAGRSSRRQKRQSSGTVVDLAKEENTFKEDDHHNSENVNQAKEEAATGYIRVRARRGHATDKHSLAERARRQKISDKMKKLQSLVPGCDKISGKALVLDEIINYVQSLQSQIEFLSMSLSSITPMPIGYTDIDLASSYEMVQPHQGQLMDTALPFALHFQGPVPFSQDTENPMALVGGVEEQWLLNHEEKSSMCSSQ